MCVDVVVAAVVAAVDIQSRVVDRTNALPRYHFVWFPKVCGGDHRLVHTESALFRSDLGSATRIGYCCNRGG